MHSVRFPNSPRIDQRQSGNRYLSHRETDCLSQDLCQETRKSTSPKWYGSFRRRLQDCCGRRRGASQLDPSDSERASLAALERGGLVFALLQIAHVLRIRKGDRELEARLDLAREFSAPRRIRRPTSKVGETCAPPMIRSAP